MEDKTMELKTPYDTIKKVQLKVSAYANNNGLYVGLNSWDEEYQFFEPYGDITVNLSSLKVPDYCGYVDTNNMPNAEQFIKEHDLGVFTGLTKRSGYCEYPLYMFDRSKLEEYCPIETAAYEETLLL